ncbi:MULTISPECIES: Ldh family oxidoreductase [Aeribacillus]|uniref:Ldh family oxidoreductase n=1 Tax=Aeribacillus TaxID=1055323 RepID=UPI001023CA14|nr:MULTISPECIES: Ldh family oxidoreductase [Aeribacillus]MED0704141.1 Ldh family oxidoreductase [Aeribacillus composti]MED0717528.1 Ldh family oxidoreductase [Aeribacillus composti]MED1442872.1 Ldh family oxidoreductase [Aeribacillus composti]RZI51815.1 Ldh family oxidoreductase [Aeribacillus pallidus]TVZ78877.1 malate dehydrogenase (NAD) [Aeribacillus composti]
MTVYDAKALKKFVEDVLVKQNVKKENAEVVADSLIRADLEGITSHGISRLPIYSKRLKEGRINPTPSIKIQKKGLSILTVDGDNGLGQIASYYGIKEGIKTARETGVAAIAIRKSNHFGCASYYCKAACDENLAAIVMTNSPPGIPPWGGKKAFFGTNPIAFGFPVKNGPDVIIDMSASVVARGKIIEAAKEGKAIPKGWAIDQRGNDTEDPAEALNGAVLPSGGVKGYGWALAVEILTGLLTGAAYGPHVENIYDDNGQIANVGHFFILIDIEKFMPVDQFTSLLQKMLLEMKAVPKKEEVHTILYPGERREQSYIHKLHCGIHLSQEVEKDLVQLANQLHLEFPTTGDHYV